MANRRKSSEEFRLQAVARTRQVGATVGQVARDIGVNPGQLSREELVLGQPPSGGPSDGEGEVPEEVAYEPRGSVG